MSMDKVARLAANQRRELFEQSAFQRGIHPAIVEKDFWVCWVLKHLFESEGLSKNLVFKGGTSLSKVYGIIDRFSEDIDLVLNWELLGYGKDEQDPWAEQPSNAQLAKFSKEFNERATFYIENTLFPTIKELLQIGPEVRPEISTKEPQVIDIHYPAAFRLSTIRPEVKLEIGPLASWVPSEHYLVTPYAAEEFPDVFVDPNCPVVAIRAERTFWEKVTILHQQSNRITKIPKGYSRHYYDTYQLANSAIKDLAFADLGLLEDVLIFKQRFYRSPWAGYEFARPGTLKLLPKSQGEIELKQDYEEMKDMIFGSRPDWVEILAGLKTLEEEINRLG
jgi:hypothetical protein